MFLTYLDEEKINISRDMISTYDKDLIITGWNPACEKRYGIPVTSALNQTLPDIFPEFHLEKDYRLNCLSDAVQQGKSFYFPHLPYQYSSGYYYQVIIPLKSADSSIVGVMNIVRDSAEVKGKITKRDLLVPIIKTDPSLISHLF